MPGIMDLLGGAASGAAAGSVVPGVGTAIGAGVGLIGMGLQMYGASQSYDAAQKQNQSQQDMIKTEMQQDQLRRTAMEVQSKRQQMEVLRNTQRARSLALNSATSQGAQQGSGLQGGYGQIAGQSGTNMLGINQNLQSGEQMFDLNAQLSQQKIAYAQAGGQAATGQALSAVGGSLIGSMGAVRNLSYGWGGQGNQGQGGSWGKGDYSDWGAGGGR